MNLLRPRLVANRRDFLSRAGGIAASLAVAGWPQSARAADDKAKRPKVAVVFTEFTHRSHAHVLVENFLNPYLFNGEKTDPGCEVVSFYGDQFPAKEMSYGIAKEYKIPIYPTIADALCVGGNELAVDAVLCIGEHGVYPVNAKGQHEYPRKRFFDEVVKVFRRSGKVVPVFNDKHLSYRWDWAREMVDTAKEMNFALMAGSSVPLAQRIPQLELPAGAKILDAVSIHGGGLDSYDFHGLEVLQAMVEARAGGETGVARVQYFDGDALWRAADAGLWSANLADTAMAIEKARGARAATLRELFNQPYGILVTYKDGLRAMVLKLGNDGTRWNFACRLAGEEKPRATSFYVGPWDNRNLFKALAHAIQTHFREGKAPYPVERTLLTTGCVAAGVESHAQGGKPIDTPHLEFAYKPIDYRRMREMGASWKILTEKVKQPKGLDLSGR